MDKVRDRLWIWGHEVGSHNNAWGLPATSTITPVEAARYLGVPNVIMVEYGGKPAPPLRPHAAAMSSCKNVVWSVIGAGCDAVQDHKSVLGDVNSLASEFPNITGVMMDDFFTIKDDQDRVVNPRASLEQLRDFRKDLSPLDLWVVVYDYQASIVSKDHVDLCDVVNFWTWEASNLKDVESNLAVLKSRFPNKRVVLGCYMWDYGKSQSMPLNLMEKQCELGLRYLQEKQIEGMVFLASCICDMGLDAVEWTRKWIAGIGDT